MAERLKAHVLKTCLGHTNVGSNPTPSASRLMIYDCRFSIVNRKSNWGGARVVEWGRLLSGYRGEILGRRFESCPPRHTKRVPAKGEERVFVLTTKLPATDFTNSRGLSKTSVRICEICG